MARRNVLQVSEYDTLYYDDASLFTSNHWKALCYYLHQASRRTAIAYFRIVHKGIRFTNYVGVIQVANLTIEILPKTDRATRWHESGTEQENKQQWHTMLLQMLVECKWLPAHQAGFAHLRLQQHTTLLDVYLSAFLSAVEKLLHEGLLKQYLPEESNQSALKGRLLFGKQLARNSIHQEHFYVSHITYDTGSVFNRIVYKALQLVGQVSNSAAIRHTAGNLLLSFPDMQPVAVSEHTFRELNYDRQTERYRQAIQYAEMLLLHTSPALTGGSVQTLAILFDMNVLWEEWVYRQLKKEEERFAITVLRQQSASFWKSEHLPVSKTIRPDIVVKTADGSTIIIDTKWKLPVNNAPDDADLKQLFVYNLYWQCQQGILLYPATNEEASVTGSYLPVPQLGNTKMNCRMILQSIFKEGRPDVDFGKRVLETILLGAGPLLLFFFV